MPSSLKKSLNESISRLRSMLLNEEQPVEKRKAYDTDKNREYIEKRKKESQVESPSDAVSRGMASVSRYADMLPTSHKLRANNVIINTLRRGAAGAVDATFIKDLDTRTGDADRFTNDTNSFDYIIQMLGVAYNMTEGQTINVGGQEIPITSDTREKIYNGFLKMFDIRDMGGRWKFFIFGSPVHSKVDQQFRPKVTKRPDGTTNNDDVNEKLDAVNHMVRDGLLANILTKGGFYDRGYAYFLKTVRARYIDLQRTEMQTGNRATNDHSYEDPSLPLSDPRMQGLTKPKSVKNVDAFNDISNTEMGDSEGAEDDLSSVEGSEHAFHMQFTDTFQTNIKGKGDLDVSDPTTYSMADFMREASYEVVRKKFGAVMAELFIANLTENPKSLQHIAIDDKYKDVYPNVYAAYFGKSKTAPAMQYSNWEKKYYAAVVAPEIERITKRYIDEMDLDMDAPKVPVKKDISGNDVAGIRLGAKGVSKDKMTYSDYVKPTDMIKSIKKKDKQGNEYEVSVKADDYDDFYNSIKENKGNEEGKKKTLLDALMKTFAQLAAPK